MIIYFPESVLELPLIKKAAEMLDLHAEEYDVPNIDLKESVILDPVKNFLSLYFLDEDIYRDEKIDYLSQSFYSVKGTPKVIQFMYAYNLLSSDCRVSYTSSQKLEVGLSGNIYTWPNYYWKEDNIKGSDIQPVDYYSEEYINRLREFFKALLYFGSLSISLDNLVIDIELKNKGGIFGDIELYMIDKQND